MRGGNGEEEEEAMVAGFGDPYNSILALLSQVREPRSRVNRFWFLYPTRIAPEH